jgi:hypothetical protein
VTSRFFAPEPAIFGQYGRTMTPRASFARLALAATFGLSLAGCPDAESPSSANDEPQMRVTIDLSKGEDNPSFTLSHSESRSFRKRVEDLEEQKNRVLPQPGQGGYQGLVLREIGRGDGRPEYRVKNGWVVVKSPTSQKGYADPLRKTEAWVIKAGQRVVPAAAYEEVRRELDSK